MYQSGAARAFTQIVCLFKGDFPMKARLVKLFVALSLVAAIFGGAVVADTMSGNVVASVQACGSGSGGNC